MTKKEYAEYLSKLIPEIEVDLESSDLSKEFYAYFQCFMPEGKNVEKIFEPLENGKSLLERILPIYKTTKDKSLQQFKDGSSPGYFCPNPIQNNEYLKELGKRHIENLKSFSTFFKESELEKMLNNVTEVIVSNEKIELKDEYLNSYLYDCISDWGIENEEEDKLFGILNEAYYSINCDYYLSYYLQYPSFTNKPIQDFLKSYFEIWKAGYYCKLEKEKLIIYA